MPVVVTISGPGHTRAIVQALRVELGVDAAKRLIADQTHSLEAYNWFMRGRALFDWDSPENLYQSISYFEKAVEADPDYAMAWGALAVSRGITVVWQATAESSPSAIMAYDRAFELDPDQSEALAAKAMMTLLLHRDWETAGKLYQRAMVSRENTTAITGYAMLYLAPIDRISHAIRLYTDAEKRDPLHAGYKASLAFLLLWSGDAEAALSKAREALELKPQHIIALLALLDAHIVSGNYSTALEVMESLPLALLQREPRIKPRAALCYAAQGDYVKASDIYRDALETILSTHSTTSTARLALSLGKVDEAIDLMEREVENRSWTHVLIRTYFRHNDAVKDHPRYLALLKRIGLDDDSVAELHRKLSFD